ncbi:MAG: sulfite exporter TauE/SafE family protein [Mycobacteriales bacterium]
MTLALAVGLGLLIGLSLGALGGGGSILTVPALVYVLGDRAQSATTGSLVIVGITAAAATLGHARAGHVRWRAGFAFGVTGILASFGGTALNARVDPNLLLVCFAGLMLVAAAAMLTKTLIPTHPDSDRDDAEAASLRRGPLPTMSPAVTTTRPDQRVSLAVGVRVAVAGIVVGFLTGFLGVGGGFVIVPALVLLLAYEMPTAVGTSLLIISLNSAVAIAARGGSHAQFHWAVIAPFTLAAVLASAGGKRIADRVSSSQLTRAFAGLLMVVATYVLARALLS